MSSAVALHWAVKHSNLLQLVALPPYSRQARGLYLHKVRLAQALQLGSGGMHVIPPALPVSPKWRSPADCQMLQVWRPFRKR